MIFTHRTVAKCSSIKQNREKLVAELGEAVTVSHPTLVCLTLVSLLSKV